MPSFDRPVSAMRRPAQDPRAGKFSQKMSVKVGSATDTMKSKDVDNFDRAGAPGRPAANYEGVNPVQVISKYAELGEALKKTQAFTEVATKIGQIADMAEQTVMQEAGDWFDQTTIKRNMKEMKAYSGQFAKIAEELDTLHQRATALYDDMGNVLARYFEMKGEGSQDPEAVDAPEQVPQNQYAGAERGAKDMGAAGQVGMEQAPPEDPMDASDGDEDDDDYGLDDMKEAEYPDLSPGWEEEKERQIKLGAKASQPTMESRGDRAGWARNTAYRPDRIKRPTTKKEGRGLALPGSQEHKDNFKTQGVEPVAEDDKGLQQNRLAIAQKAIKRPAALAKVMTGMTRAQARETIKASGAKTVKEAKKAMAKEAINLLAQKLTEMNAPASPVKEAAVDSKTKEQQLRTIVQQHQMGKVDGQKVDAFSASAILVVLDALNPENKEKFLSLPVMKMATIAFKLVK